MALVDPTIDTSSRQRALASQQAMLMAALERESRDLDRQEERRYREAATRQAHANALAFMERQAEINRQALVAEQERQNAIARGGLRAMSQNPALADLFLPYQEAEFDPSAFSEFTPERALESGIPVSMDTGAVYPSQEQADAAIANMMALGPADFSNLSDTQALGAYNAISAMAPTMMQTAATEEAARLRAAGEQAKREYDEQVKARDREYDRRLKLQDRAVGVTKSLYTLGGPDLGNLDPDLVAGLTGDMKTEADVARFEGIIEYAKTFKDPQQRAVAELYMTRMTELDRRAREAMKEGEFGALEEIAAEYDKQATDLYKSLLEKNTGAAGYFNAITLQKRYDLKAAAARYGKAQGAQGWEAAEMEAQNLANQIKNDKWVPNLTKQAVTAGEGEEDPPPPTLAQEERVGAGITSAKGNRAIRVMDEYVSNAQETFSDRTAEAVRFMTPGVRTGSVGDLDKTLKEVMAGAVAANQPIPENIIDSLQKEVDDGRTVADTLLIEAKTKPVRNVLTSLLGGTKYRRGVNMTENLDVAQAMIDRLKTFNKNKEYLEDSTYGDYLKRALAPTPRPSKALSDGSRPSLEGYRDYYAP